MTLLLTKYKQASIGPLVLEIAPPSLRKYFQISTIVHETHEA